MQILSRKHSVILGILLCFSTQMSFAGPPFFTDDPQPVDFKHWEYYISSINSFQQGSWTGTSPHFEVNYGLIPNIQVHMILPMNYNYTGHQNADFGYADTEFGMKYRFIQETKDCPQIGTFPIVELPTVKNSTFSSGRTHIYLPIWAQKSWGKFTTYGGVGYWINPGSTNKNWTFTGWEAQYDLSSVVTLGAEVYHRSADIIGNKSSTALNFGGLINASKTTHFIFSLGHSLANASIFSCYVGLQWTI